MLLKKTFLLRDFKKYLLLKKQNDLFYKQGYLRNLKSPNTLLADYESHFEIKNSMNEKAGSSVPSFFHNYSHKNYDLFQFVLYSQNYRYNFLPYLPLYTEALLLLGETTEYPKSLFFLRSVKGGFTCYSMGFLGFLPYSHALFLCVRCKNNLQLKLFKGEFKEYISFFKHFETLKNEYVFKLSFFASSLQVKISKRSYKQRRFDTRYKSKKKEINTSLVFLLSQNFSQPVKK